jgi:3-deoxy-D-manno-octulosonate 8-phosphate phosphatase (KDO 8-P phosphatase)
MMIFENKHSYQSNPFLNISSEIKLIAVDVDGVMTDGGIYIDNFGNQMKKFNSKDGVGIKLLQNYGLEIVFISGSNSSSINQRANALGIKYIFTGISNKLNTISKIQKQLGINPSQTIFLGDDINDLLVLPAVKMFLSPRDAHISCLEKAHWIGKFPGGAGFFREFADLFLDSLDMDPNKLLLK